MNPVAARHRNESLRRLGDTPLDVLVLGGGIVGSGIARDAAMRGLREASVEKRIVSEIDLTWRRRSSRLPFGVRPSGRPKPDCFFSGRTKVRTPNSAVRVFARVRDNLGTAAVQRRFFDRRK